MRSFLFIPSLRHRSKETQRGAALMIMLIFVVLGVVAALLNSLSTSSMKSARQEKTATALAQAKDALIGRAVINENMPGSLPCPDIDNDGSAELLSGNNCPNYLGRLPWRTLKLPDLRDSSSERLWYALSTNFRDDDSARPLNSDTQGQLTIKDSAGNISASGVIAIIFSPSVVVGTQVRNGTNANAVVNFLEGENVNGDTTYIISPETDDFNDRLMPISSSNLFPPVEKVVGKRTANLLNFHLSSYWGTSLYPFAAPFSNPSTSFFIPSSGNTHGLLPSTAVWANVPSYFLSGGSASVSCSLQTGSNSLANARARCTISGISDTPTITINGSLNYLGLWRKYDLSNLNEVLVRVKGLSCAAPNSGSSSTVDCAAATVPGLNAAISYTVNTNSSVAVSFTGNLISAITRIELRDVVVDAANDWFTKNKWQQLMYYAVSPGYAPSGSNSCAPLPGAPSCLTVKGSGGGDDKRAVIIMTGAALAGSHPSGNLADYLEGENVTPTDFIYENKSRTSTFNDQGIIVSP